MKDKCSLAITGWCNLCVRSTLWCYVALYGPQHPAPPMNWNWHLPLQFSPSCDSWCPRCWLTHFLAFYLLMNSWKQWDCSCRLQGMPCVLLMENRGHTQSRCWHWQKEVSLLAFMQNSFLTSMKQLIITPFFWSCVVINLLQVIIKLSLI